MVWSSSRSNEVSGEVDKIHDALLPKDGFDTSTVFPPLLYTILDYASGLPRDSLGHGKGIQNGLSSLLSYLEFERGGVTLQHQPSSSSISASPDHPSPPSPSPRSPPSVGSSSSFPSTVYPNQTCESRSSRFAHQIKSYGRDKSSAAGME